MPTLFAHVVMTSNKFRVLQLNLDLLLSSVYILVEGCIIVRMYST